jgi:molybdopterin-guanine dinucleotide biosynthesis protein A
MMATAIVLAGGKGSRLGVDKALAVVGGRNLIHRVVEQLMLVSEQVLIVGSPCQFSFPPSYKIEYREDLYSARGPLSGIYTGLVASKSLYNLVVACDMPFLNIKLLGYMLKLSPGFDAVVPRMKRIEPLHAVYSKSCLGSIKRQLESNQAGVTRFLSTINVRWVEQAECQRFDPKLLSFFNINSEVDLAQANILAKEEVLAYNEPMISVEELRADSELCPSS